MHPILTLKNVSLSFGAQPLLDRVNMQLERGERVCLVGRNGSGKTTLLRVLSGEIHADDGEFWRPDGLRIARLHQDVPTGTDKTVFEVVAGGLPRLGALLADYHHLLATMGDSPQQVARLSELQHELEVNDGWLLEQRVASAISRLGLDGDAPLDSLSGGLKRRVMLARALVSEPDLLLLDEPTNHLDIEGITWLEQFLLTYNGCLLFITHDRAFLQHLATRIIELDRGALSSWPGDYAAYLQHKEQRLEVEQQHQALFDKKLAQEETWIRQGIKARRTRNMGRVRALQDLREQRGQRREQTGKVRLNLDEADASGKLVVELEDVSFAYDQQPILRNFSTRIMRGDRVGIIGPNGAGKSTLIRILLGEQQPDSGQVRQGSKLQIAYFDQYRALLDPEKTVLENLNDGNEMVEVQGRQRHAIGYLREFLFPPQQVHAPVKALSGGERNRLLLARLFTRPANLLVLDEPTNDLDVETLELLEELLLDYSGTLLLVSHDRSFLDNVVTSVLVFEGEGEGEGQVNEFVGGYRDWQAYRQQHPLQDNRKAGPPAPIAQQAGSDKNLGAPPRRKLGYKEQRELDSLPARIEVLESQQQALLARIGEPEFYQQAAETVSQTLQQLEAVEAELETCYQRWGELEAG